MLAGNKSGAVEWQLNLKSYSIQYEWTVPTKVLSGSCWDSEESMVLLIQGHTRYCCSVTCIPVEKTKTNLP